MSALRQSRERKELRVSLRAVMNRVADLDQHSLSEGVIPNITFSPMVLDEESESRPIFFAPYPAASIRIPDDNYDRVYEAEYTDFESIIDADWRTPKNCARVTEHYLGYYIEHHALLKKYTDDDIQWSRVSISDPPFFGIYQYKYPEFGSTGAEQERSGRFPHLKAMIYNDLDGTDDQLHRGELLIAMRMMMAQLKRALFLGHMVVPVLLVSFMGPQHARIIEAYFTGKSLVVRPTRLYDFRKKDAEAFKTFAQWYLGKPIGTTTVAPGGK